MDLFYRINMTVLVISTTLFAILGLVLIMIIKDKIPCWLWRMAVCFYIVTASVLVAFEWHGIFQIWGF